MAEIRVWIEEPTENVKAAVADSLRVDQPDDANFVLYQPAFRGFWTVRSVQDTLSDLFTAEFDANRINQNKAERFFETVQARLIKPFDHAYPLEDFVLVAVSERAGPDAVEIVQKTLEMEPERTVLIRLPDGEAPSARMARFDLDERAMFTRAHADRLLASCSYTVTQADPIAVQGLLHQKTAIQFAQSDCHHVFRKTYAEKRLKKCYNRMHRDRPEYAAYIYWLLTDRLLDEQDANFGEKLLARLAG